MPGEHEWGGDQVPKALQRVRLDHNNPVPLYHRATLELREFPVCPRSPSIQLSSRVLRCYASSGCGSPDPTNVATQRVEAREAGAEEPELLEIEPGGQPIEYGSHGYPAESYSSERVLAEL